MLLMRVVLLRCRFDNTLPKTHVTSSPYSRTQAPAATGPQELIGCKSGMLCPPLETALAAAPSKALEEKKMA